MSVMVTDAGPESGAHIPSSEADTPAVLATGLSPAGR
jgi:hypothetical protein